MLKSGWAKRQIRNTERNVACWPAWMRREGRLKENPRVQDELTEELASKFMREGAARPLALRLARAAYEEICGWEPQIKARGA